MGAAVSTIPFVSVAESRPLAPAGLGLAPPGAAELDELRGDHELARELDALLVRVARSSGAVELAIGEALAAFGVGDRAMRRGWASISDHAREVLDLSRRSAQGLARLARELPRRPLLRGALCSGEVSIRKAQVVLPVAVGEDEARWVERARADTVRALEAAVKAVGRPAAEEDDEGWEKLSAPLAPEKLAVVDEALALAAKTLGKRSTRAQQLEALAQEYLGEHPLEESAERCPCSGFRKLSPPRSARIAELQARLERETERWRDLAQVEPLAAVEAGLEGERSPKAIEARLCELATTWRSWDRLLGWLALVVKRSRIFDLFGFADFSRYCDERLGLGGRTVEQRVWLEERLWEVPALRQAVENGLSYEKARLVARRRDPAEIDRWLFRSEELTCIALRRAMDAEEETQMRARRRIVLRVPSRVAALLSVAFEAARRARKRPLSPGECLVELAEHFIAVWKPLVKGRRTRSRKVRERDLGWCLVPGCSRGADDAHHVLYRSLGGGHDPSNLVSLCSPHHLRGVHMGNVRVHGRAPTALVWELGEREALRLDGLKPRPSRTALRSS